MSICNGDIPTFYSIFFGLEIWQHIQKGDSEKSLSTSLPVPLEGLGGFHFVPLNLRKGILSTYIKRFCTILGMWRMLKGLMNNYSPFLII